MPYFAVAQMGLENKSAAAATFMKGLPVMLGMLDSNHAPPQPARIAKKGIAGIQCFVPPKIGVLGMAMIKIGTIKFNITSQVSNT